MSCILYLWRKTLKNYCIQAVKKPLVLILGLLFVALIVFAMVASGPSGAQPTEQKMEGYAAILMGVFLFVFVISIMNGMKQGAALFAMADVNLLFTAPVSPGKILMSGVTKQAGVMAMASLFLLAQYPNMRNLAGLDGMALAGLLIAYTGVGVVLNILAAVLYAYCAGSDTRRKRISYTLYALFAALLALVAWFLLREGDALGALTMVMGADAWNYVPIVGWARGVAISFAEHAYGKAAIFAALLALGGYACVRLLRGSDMDYYEDVLLAAERANQVREDAQAGRVSTQGEVSSRVKREMGALKGRGASAFTYRILREQSRGGVWLLDSGTLMAAVAPVLGIILMGREIVAEAGLWPLFTMTAWFILFSNLRSGLPRELTYPTLYLAPCGSFAKLVAVLAPQWIKAAVDGVVFAALCVALYGLGAGMGAISLLFYLSISMVYSAGYLIVERLLGSSRNKVLIMLLYMLILMLLCMPGMIGAMIVGASWPPALQYLAGIGWNVAITLLVVLLCRNILTKLETA